MSAFRRLKANRVVAEINNGGEMVAQVLRQHDPNLPVRSVTATRGKFLRAEPVAAAYERGAVFHLGVFDKLEDQLCALTSDFDARVSGFSRRTAPTLLCGRSPTSSRPRRPSPPTCSTSTRASGAKATENKT